MQESAAQVGNVFLVGLMGAGKTTVGRLLAGRLGVRFIDTDHVIQERTGVSIPTIFEIEGEMRFRERECQVVDEMSGESGIVLATGGGAILAESNRHCLQARGRVIYLHGQPRDLWLRTRNDRNRPLLTSDDPLKKLTELYQLRDPLYRQVAHIVIDTARQPARWMVEQLLIELGAVERKVSPANPSINETFGCSTESAPPSATPILVEGNTA
jgi:shikimate kinase